MGLESLTDAQFDIAVRAYPFPAILGAAGEKVAARALERKGWGTVEGGAAEDVLFRLSQDGEDQVAFEVKSWTEQTTTPQSVEA